MNFNSAEIKRQNKIRIAQYVLSHESVSRQRIAFELGFSMPTVFQNVTELIEKGILREAGEFGSTGGRKAKMLEINPHYGSAIGLSITKNHIHMAQTDMFGHLLMQEDIRHPYCNTFDYYRRLGEILTSFVEKVELEKRRLVGVGISIPGILNKEKTLLYKSYALHVANVSLSRFMQYIAYPVCFENDATNAAYADIPDRGRDTVYIALNSTVGGAICIGGQFYEGDNCKSAEFGHIVIHPGGRRCYCGKIGCMDAYCATTALTEDGRDGLEAFFHDLDMGSDERARLWTSYLDDLAIAITNLRTAFDCNIVVGGDMGGYLEERLSDLCHYLRRHNNLDSDDSYLKVGHYKRQSAAIGAARHMTEQFLRGLE